jgi:VCBS repeat-containing protein
MLAFITRGIRGAYAYEVSADNDLLGQGTTSADQFTVPVTFGASGVSMITVTLTVEGKPLTFLFSLAIS